MPVAGEPPGDPSSYGNDRTFVYIKLENGKDKLLEEKISALTGSGLPVITIHLKDLLDLGQEFLRWEIATATAGSVLGINPFDQPNVQESKDNTNRLLKHVEQEGKLPEEKPTLVDGPLQFFSNGGASDAKGLLANLLGTVRQGDYVSIQAYLTEDAAIDSSLQDLRMLMRNRLRIATTAGLWASFSPFDRPVSQRRP